ncbi:MAG: T9SS type A sorting domain-containing protein [Chitinophagales bacterium]|nr:T9SS type A sorting domain-containing protein [Chitinophagales bacterium]
MLTKQEYTVPLQSFPDGILILRVNTGSKIVTRKFIKQQ